MATLESLETAIEINEKHQGEFRGEVKDLLEAMNGRARTDHDKISVLEGKQEATAKRVDRLFGVETVFTLVSSAVAAIIGTRQ